MMDGRKNRIYNWAIWALLIASVLLLAGQFAVTSSSFNVGKAATRLQKNLSKRAARLDAYMQEALDQDNDKWMDLPGLPQDMVVYKYLSDSLKFWNNQFTLGNDDISSRMLFQSLSNPRAGTASPLQAASEKPTLMDMGSRWYLVKALEKDDVKVIGGLLVIDVVNGRRENAINDKLGVRGNFIIQTLDCPGGATVYLDGEPFVHLFHDVTEVSPGGNPGMLWLALALWLSGMWLVLLRNRSGRQCLISLGSSIAAILLFYFYGRETQAAQTLFSPALYAKGQVFYSLGALLLINLAAFISIVSIYLCRRGISRAYLKWPLWGKILSKVMLALFIAGIWIYVHALMRDVISNSSITLELYKFNSLSWFTLIIYLSFLSLLMSSFLLCMMLFPLVGRRHKHNSGGKSKAFRLAASVLTAVFILTTTGFAGYRKEHSQQTVWATRLSMSRDVALELQLRTVENSVASDPVIAALSGMDGTEMLILNRIAENYLPRASQAYNMQLYLLDSSRSTPETIAFFRERMQDNQGIADDSRFTYLITQTASTIYTGVFVYFPESRGAVTMVLDILPKSSLRDKGYASLLDLSSPGQVSLPASYSFARYKGHNLASYSGNYAYPTYMSESMHRQIFSSGDSTFSSDGFTHFITLAGEEDAILISRPRISTFSYFLALLFLSVLIYLAMSLITMAHDRHKVTLFSSHYYRSTATTVLVVSLVLTLVVMAIVSVIFVYDRNEANMKAMMSDKVNSIQTMLQQESAGARSTADLDTPAFANVMRLVGEMAHTDISLYDTQGKVFKSTTPEVYERMLIGSRVDEKAYEGIVYRNQRYVIQKERTGRQRYYAMYAPLFSPDGRMTAILSSPYVEENYDFEQEAVLHLVTILTVFMILLLIARIGIETVLDRLFKPLVEMGRKMSSAGLDKLEYIQYDRDDEVSSLVGAYNRMVNDLTRSSQQLAQAERDRAWSAMARQVAHEIKNPLTPMKLQIQRVIRLKERGDASWQERFDECTKVVLDHIDILSDTANEFSTFARLYTEEPTEVDLNAMLSEEVAMFDGREGVEFLYLGLEGARATAPKPQLTRVFVNLLTNAVQAVEGARAEALEAGRTPYQGRIQVSLRLSSAREGCYDIVFEDNGPGVSEENTDKLFTPNFTTKTGGTGLGLAICRNILDKCEATISYSRSTSLGGACFTIVYPKLA